MQLSVFLTGATLILTMATAPIAYAEPPVQPLNWVLADSVRVRSGPSTEDRVQGTLSRGAEVVLKGAPVVGDFCLIEGEGQYGYVACKYLSAERIARPKAGENGIEAAQRWVSGNGVTLREKPQFNATAVGRLSLNANVKLVREDVGNGYCEVQAINGMSGYTACRYLAVTPVVLAHVQGYRMADQPPPADYDPERAFWLAPSWNALEQYAEYLKSRNSETPLQGTWPRNEALERMKAHLALGLKGIRPQPYVDWTELKRKASKDLNLAEATGPVYDLQRAIGIYGELHDTISAKGGATRVVQLIRALEFPNIQPSLFRNEDELAPPVTSTEEASGRFNIVYRQLATPRPKQKPNGEIESGAGLYDMLARTQVLVRPVQRVQLFRDGRLRVEPSLIRWKETLWRDVDAPMCEGWVPGFGFGDADAKMWRYFDSSVMVADNGSTSRSQSLKRNPIGSLFVFYTNIDLPSGPAVRTETSNNLDREDTGFVRGTHLLYDLNGDGIPDIAIWEGQGYGPGHLGGSTTTDDRWYRLIVANVAGKWKVLGSDVFSYGCGC